MRIFTRAEWGARPPADTTPFKTIEGWVVHWVGGTGMRSGPTFEQTVALLRGLQSDALSEDYVDFEYNFLVDPMGRIFEGRGWNNRSGANGTTSSNAYCWSVVYAGGPGTPLTRAAKDALSWLTQEGARRRGSVSYVKPHRRIVSTACPGDELADFCVYLNAHLHDTPAPPTSPKPSDEEELMVIPAPARLQTDLNRPKYAWLDKANKRVWFEGGIKPTVPHYVGKNGQSVTSVGSVTPIIGWYWDEKREEIVVTAQAYDKSKSPAFRYKFQGT